MGVGGLSYPSSGLGICGLRHDWRARTDGVVLAEFERYMGNRRPESGASIWIAARELETGDLEIRFKDTGAGISEEMLGEILEPFRQADGGRSRRFEGVGLGLAMASSIAKLHNSKLDIESEIDIGTTVVHTIPASRVVADNMDTANIPAETPDDDPKDAVAA